MRATTVISHGNRKFRTPTVWLKRNFQEKPHTTPAVTQGRRKTFLKKIFAFSHFR